ncbi:MAG TPA: bifunctional uridylyltransferase/uridylyl-removing protein, partial [Achromobacter sp.]|nr:bifunctional uridylyltransferase/uridylyl-removing protein [Achromobacter sp.]
RVSRVFPVMPQAELQPDERSTSWRLSVTATDRPGLLHALARVFARHEINLLMAKIMTLGDRVEDVFIVDGSALARPRSQMQFERDILDALSGDEAQQRAA